MKIGTTLATLKLEINLPVVKDRLNIKVRISRADSGRARRILHGISSIPEVHFGFIVKIMRLISKGVRGLKKNVLLTVRFFKESNSCGSVEDY